MNGSTYTLQIVSSFTDIKQPEWDALTYSKGRNHNLFKNNSLGKDFKSKHQEKESEENKSRDESESEYLTLKNSYNPFISYDFLYSLEVSNSAIQSTGWIAHHVLLKDKQNTIVAAMPCYLKTHSMGEYVFDHGWAEAYEHAGGQYYPKLQASIPFTPATTPKLLAQSDLHRQILAKAAKEITSSLGLSSLHATFVTSDDAKIFQKEGYLQRIDQQFHWKNKNYASFDDFLQNLSSRKRKQIKKERKEALENNIEIRFLTGSDLKEEHWDHFYAFYQDTGSRKWGQPYLTRQFFSHISEKMCENILLIFAYRNNKPIAGALNFIGSDTLYGRNWGATEYHSYLHFEVCYYQAIDFAIEHGLQTVEAGAQGQHKLARGYEPVKTQSMHWIPNSGFRNAIENYLRSETKHVNFENAILQNHTPFKKTDF
jgi:hypothetical protein